MNKLPNTALLVMDIMNGTISRLGDHAAPLISSLTSAIVAARAADIPLIYVVVAFRKGFPEISPGNKSFTTLRQNPAVMAGLEEPVTIHASVTPQPGEVVVTKRRFSAFTGSDLEVVLRARDIRHMVLTGVSTSGVVLSTLREAADKDYRLTVLSDCCADADAEVHRVLLGKVFPRQADVMTAGEWVSL